MKTPNPGSDDAIAHGCRCPVIDNARGRGYMGQPDFLCVVCRLPDALADPRERPET